eukprot:140678-Chlamydomonas_euryale.AAC.3
MLRARTAVFGGGPTDRLGDGAPCGQVADVEVAPVGIHVAVVVEADAALVLRNTHATPRHANISTLQRLSRLGFEAATAHARLTCHATTAPPSAPECTSMPRLTAVQTLSHPCSKAISPMQQRPSCPSSCI